jgi:hypothetical protein
MIVLSRDVYIPCNPHDKSITHGMLAGVDTIDDCDLARMGVKFHDLYFFKDIVVELRKGYTEAQRVVPLCAL